MVKAIGMMSGGLDSTLAAAVLQRQGIEVLGINFYTGFCVTEQHRRLGIPGSDGKPCRNEALRAGADLGFEVRLVDTADEYFDMIRNPRHGYGSAANPCVDCRMFMLGKVKDLLEEEGADFVFTGEVLGQRPMSQRAPVMRIIEKGSGLEGRLLRPLSAKLLAPTEPELDGRVDRDGLLDFCGRTRKPQIELAKALGITDYPQPAGGCCFLADLNYARKFFDLVANRPAEQKLTHEDVILLSVGRHFRLPEGDKVIVGRNEHENRVLENYGRGRHWVMKPADLMGPTLLVEGTAEYPALATAVRIGGRYADRNGADLVRYECRRGDLAQTLQGLPLTPAEIDAYRIQNAV